jgi:hypothetical protein
MASYKPQSGHSDESRSPEAIEITGFPFGFAQGGESFDSAQDREPVERLVEPRLSPE